MATRNPTVTFVGNDTIVFSYGGMLNGDDGAPISPNHSNYADRSVEVFGTFGVGGSVTVEGAPDPGSTYAALRNASSVTLAITAAGHEQILEVPAFTRPRVTAGDGTTSLTVVITCRKRFIIL